MKTYLGIQKVCILNQNNMPDSLTDFLVGIRKSGDPARLWRGLNTNNLSQRGTQHYNLEFNPRWSVSFAKLFLKAGLSLDTI